MFIRPSNKADLPAVDALIARSYPKVLKVDYPPSILVTAFPIIARARPELLACGTYYVAQDGTAILGAGGGGHRIGMTADWGTYAMWSVVIVRCAAVLVAR